MSAIDVAVAYHSGYGHTAKVAEAVVHGVMQAGKSAVLIDVSNITEEQWLQLDGSKAIIFGAPTYMGGASAQFKQFADASSKRWFTQAWKDKYAGGFTCSLSMSGDNACGDPWCARSNESHWLFDWCDGASR
jgi:NAD(P)H dehydrogenase (quinone)